MSHCLAPAFHFVIRYVPAPRSRGVELCHEQADEALDVWPVLFEERGVLRVVPELLIAARTGNDRYAMVFEFEALFAIWPIPMVGQQAATKGGLQKGIQSMHVMAIARHLKHESQAAVGSEDQMLAHPHKPTVQRAAIPLLRHAVKAFPASLSDGAADVDRVRVYDEKGGSSSSSSPAIVAKTPARRSTNGPSSVRRSTQFWRDKRLGKNSRMTWLFSNHP